LARLGNCFDFSLVQLHKHIPDYIHNIIYFIRSRLIMTLVLVMVMCIVNGAATFSFILLSVIQFITEIV